MYSYEFVDVRISNGIKETKDNNIKECEEIIKDKASQGYRLVQIIPVPNEKWGVYSPQYYKIILEKEIRRHKKGPA